MPSDHADRPMPEDEIQQARITEQLRRRLILTGHWQRLAEEAIHDEFAPEVADNVIAACPDLSINPLKFFAQELSVLYQSPPRVEAADTDPEQLSLITPARLWSQMGDLNRNVNAVREGLVRLDFAQELGRLSWRIVDADMVWEATGPDHDPARPHRIVELRWRVVGGEGQWTWETWDISDHADPVFTIEAIGEDGERVNVTEAASGFTAGTYPYLDRAGAPILPYVMYHDRFDSKMWHPMEGVELVNGTLGAAVMRTHWRHGYREGSYSEVHAINLEPMGGRVEKRGDGNVQVMVRDVTAIASWRQVSDGPAGFTVVSQRYDSLSNLQAIRAYIADLALFMGLSGAHIEASASPESGIALSIKAEGKRQAQKRQQPVYREADQLMLSVAARLQNAYGGGSLPEDPDAYSIQYAPLPRTPTEIRAKAELAQTMREAGVASDVDVLQAFFPDLSRDQAIDQLAGVALDRVAVQGRALKLAAEQDIDPALIAPPKEPPRVGYLTATLDAQRAARAGEVSRDEAIRFIQAALQLSADEAAEFIEDNDASDELAALQLALAEGDQDAAREGLAELVNILNRRRSDAS